VGTEWVKEKVKKALEVSGLSFGSTPVSQVPSLESDFEGMVLLAPGMPIPEIIATEDIEYKGLSRIYDAFCHMRQKFEAKTLPRGSLYAPKETLSVKVS
jgi:hypothetical protein